MKKLIVLLALAAVVAVALPGTVWAAASDQPGTRIITATDGTSGFDAGPKAVISADGELKSPSQINVKFAVAFKVGKGKPPAGGAKGISLYCGKYHNLNTSTAPPSFTSYQNSFNWDEYTGNLQYGMGDPWNANDYATVIGEARAYSKAEIPCALSNFSYIYSGGRVTYTWYRSRDNKKLFSWYYDIPSQQSAGGNYWEWYSTCCWIGKFPHEINETGGYYCAVSSPWGSGTINVTITGTSLHKYQSGKYHNLTATTSPYSISQQQTSFNFDEYPMGDPYNANHYATNIGEPASQSTAEMIASLGNYYYLADGGRVTMTWYKSGVSAPLYTYNHDIPSPSSQGSLYWTWYSVASWIGKFPAEINAPGSYYVAINAPWESKTINYTVTSAPFSFVHLTDLHVAASASLGDYDLDGAAFGQVIAGINGLNPKPAFVVATGDVCHAGDWSSAQYPDVIQRLSPNTPLTNPAAGAYYADAARTIPIYFVPGNHDYREASGGPTDTSPEQYPARLGPLSDYVIYRGNSVLIGLNSGYDASTLFGDLMKPEGQGLSNAQMAWLHGQLDNLDGVNNGRDDSGKKKIIFMHHPAVADTGTLWNGAVNTNPPRNRADGAIGYARDWFLNQCDSFGVHVVLTGHEHQSVDCNRNGANWTSGTRYIQTAEGFRGCYRTIDVGSAVTVSAPQRFNITDNQSPSTSITSPANNSNVTVGSTVVIKASASDNMGVTKVEFYVNGSLKGTDNSSPFSYNWLVPTAKATVYTLTTKAYDAAGNVTTSTPIMVNATTDYWTVKYEADQLPDAATPPWSYTVYVGSPSRSVASGILTQTSPAYSGWKYRRDWGASDATGITILARLKVAAGSDPQELSICDGSYSVSLYFFDYKLQFRSSSYTLTTQSYHTYRVTLKSGTAKLYVDEGATPVLQVNCASLADNFIALLDGWSTSSTSVIYLDYLYYSTSGAYAPGTKEESIREAAADITADQTGFSSTHNPFVSQTTISYQLALPSKVSLKVYNISGQLVKTLVSDYKPAGYQSVRWDGRDASGNKVAAGVYLYRMESGDYSATKKLTVLK